MHLLQSLKGKLSDRNEAPPQWAPAPEISHRYGLWNEAPEDEFDAAEEFCAEYPPYPSRLIPSHAVDRINAEGCKAWGIELPISPRFAGYVQNPEKSGPNVIKVETRPACRDVSLLSDLPLMAGLYDIQGKSGVYYEILIHRMDGIIAVGMYMSY